MFGILQTKNIFDCISVWFVASGLYFSEIVNYKKENMA